MKNSEFYHFFVTYVDLIYHNTCFVVTYDPSFPYLREIIQNIDNQEAKQTAKYGIDPKAFFFTQVVNLFVQLEKDEEEFPITYSFTSHSYTVYLLQILEKYGVVSISYKKNADSDNLKEYREHLNLPPRNKPIRMFEVQFQLTGKKLTPLMVEQVAIQLNLDLNFYRFIKKYKGWAYCVDLTYMNYYKDETMNSSYKTLKKKL